MKIQIFPKFPCHHRIKKLCSLLSRCIRVKTSALRKLCSSQLISKKLKNFENCAVFTLGFPLQTFQKRRKSRSCFFRSNIYFFSSTVTILQIIHFSCSSYFLTFFGMCCCFYVLFLYSFFLHKENISISHPHKLEYRCCIQYKKCYVLYIKSKGG